MSYSVDSNGLRFQVYDIERNAQGNIQNYKGRLIGIIDSKKFDAYLEKVDPNFKELLPIAVIEEATKNGTK